MGQSFENMIDSADIPLLVKGGASSSSVLNAINQNIQSDIARLNLTVQELDRTQRMLATYLDVQANSIGGLVNHLASIIPAAPANRGVVDFYSIAYVHADNTAEIDTYYGQATLPITNVQEKMYSIDQGGNVFIPDTSRIKYCASTSYTDNVIPDDSLFYSSIDDYRGIAGTPDNFFLGGYVEREKYIYIKAIIPDMLNMHKLANRITVRPIPAFAHTLVGAYIKRTSGEWLYIPKNYLPFYANGVVPFCGPFRLHFEPAEINEVCVVFKVLGWWGLQEFSAQLVEYESSANLVVDLQSYVPTSPITTVLINGRSPQALRSLPYTVEGTVVTIPLSQIASYQSPVITDIDCRW